MGENTITITLEQYNKLSENVLRMELLKAYVAKKTYLDKEDIAFLLGMESEEEA